MIETLLYELRLSIIDVEVAPDIQKSLLVSRKDGSNVAYSGSFMN